MYFVDILPNVNKTWLWTHLIPIVKDFSYFLIAKYVPCLLVAWAAKTKQA